MVTGENILPGFTDSLVATNLHVKPRAAAQQKNGQSSIVIPCSNGTMDIFSQVGPPPGLETEFMRWCGAERVCTLGLP